MVAVLSMDGGGTAEYSEYINSGGVKTKNVKIRLNHELINGMSLQSVCLSGLI